MDKERFPDKKAVVDQKRDLTRANLTNTILTRADFTGANLTNMVLHRADLELFVAQGAKGLDNY